jgi:hypothetical protein
MVLFAEIPVGKHAHQQVEVVAHMAES